jgi:hypothetical protein
MRATTIAALLLAGAVGVPAAEAQIPRSTCADCHYARPEAPAQDHLFNWDRSPHGANNIGCERCHGGDATTFEALAAHRTILDSGNPKSPVHRRNLPTTCGGCHVGPFVAFQDSRHYQLLEEGRQHGPTCSTCHDAVAGRLLSPRGLESRCASCHGPDEIAPRAARARNARELYERIAAIRAEVKLADRLTKSIADPARRAQLATMREQVDIVLTRAINAGHRFVYDELQQYTDLAQQRTQALLAALTASPTRQ